MHTVLASPDVPNARVPTFEGVRGYATEANARKRLATTAHLWDGCQAVVACHNGRFYPVVIYRAGCANMPALCALNVCIMN